MRSAAESGGRSGRPSIFSRQEVTQTSPTLTVISGSNCRASRFEVRGLRHQERMPSTKGSVHTAVLASIAAEKKLRVAPQVVHERLCRKRSQKRTAESANRPERTFFLSAIHATEATCTG